MKLNMGSFGRNLIKRLFIQIFIATGILNLNAQVITQHMWGSNENALLNQPTREYTIFTKLFTDSTFQNAKDMSCNSSNFIIKEDGTMWAWGRNDYYQLGLNHNTSPVVTPVQVGTDDDWVKVRTNGYATIALKSNGIVYVTGNNKSQRLRSKYHSDNYFKEFTYLYTSKKFSEINIGGFNNPDARTWMLALDSNDELFGWGNNSIGTKSTAILQRKFYAFVAPNNATGFEITSMISDASVNFDADYDANYVIKTDSTLWVWGGNSSDAPDLGHLGVNSDFSYAVSTPTKVGSASNWISVAAGRQFALILNADGELYACGKNAYGQLGIGNTSDTFGVTQVGSATNWKRIWTGYENSYAENEDGELYVFGRNLNSELGLNSTSNITSPEKVNLVEIDGVYKLSGSIRNTIILDSSGVLWGCGVNEYSVFMQNSSYNLLVDSAINAPTPYNWSVLTPLCGEASWVGNDENNSVRAWGISDYGITSGYPVSGTSPKEVGYYGYSATEFEAGANHILMTRSSGLLYAWGNNDSGQCGIASNTGSDTVLNTPKPVKYQGQYAFIPSDFSAGYDHSCAIMNGKMYCWGNSDSGQLGFVDPMTGNPANANYPTQVGSDTDWEEVTCGYHFTIARKTDGSLHVWGANTYGQLGAGLRKTVNQLTPRRISSDSWTHIDAQFYTVIARKSDGSIYTWGKGDKGQMGDYLKFDAISPAKVGSKTDWISVAAGNHVMAAINENHQLYVWGTNTNGLLAANTGSVTTEYLSPTRINGDSNWLDVRFGLAGACGRRLNFKRWNGSGNFFYDTSNWLEGIMPHIGADSIVIASGTCTIDSAYVVVENITVAGNSTLSLQNDVTLKDLYVQSGIVSLNSYELTLDGSVDFDTSSTNHYLKAFPDYIVIPYPKLNISPSASWHDTLYFMPSYKTLRQLTIGSVSPMGGSVVAELVIGNDLQIKGGADSDSGPGKIKIETGSKIIIPDGSELILKSDTFNAFIDCTDPIHRSVICKTGGKLSIERDHYGRRGWRLYSHPFNTDITLEEIADDIDLIGAGGTSEGFMSNYYKNASAYWYDYTNADTTKNTDPGWIPFTSAKGTTISGNHNKWKKNQPLLLFNPGTRKGSGSFSDPGNATYESGKIILSYTLDSNDIHLNDGVTQTISTADLVGSESLYFLITNPYTTPIKLCRIQGLDSNTVDPYYYYWKQRRNIDTNNFNPAIWESELILNGNSTRDSNISLPAFGVMLVRLKSYMMPPTFTIAEDAMQKTEFSYLVGGTGGNDYTGKMFAGQRVPQQGPGAIELKLNIHDSAEVDRLIIYDVDAMDNKPAADDNNAPKFLDNSFPQIYTTDTAGNDWSLYFTNSDSNSRLKTIPLSIYRDDYFKKGPVTLELWENNTSNEIILFDSLKRTSTPIIIGDRIPLTIEEGETSNRYYLKVQSIKQTNNANQLKRQSLMATPNPTSGKLKILGLQNTQKNSDCEVFDLSGRLAMKTQLKQGELNVSPLKTGVYFLQVEGVSNSISIIKK